METRNYSEFVMENDYKVQTCTQSKESEVWRSLTLVSPMRARQIRIVIS
jgi:hypothetical protein